MDFGIPIRDGDDDDEKEMDSLMPDTTYGKWSLSCRDKIIQLSKSVDRNILKADEYIKGSQRRSSISEEELEDTRCMISEIQREVTKLDNAIREWIIELAGDPIGYRDSKLELDKYTHHQKTYIERIDELNKKFNDLSTRVVLQNHGNNNYRHKLADGKGSAHDSEFDHCDYDLNVLSNKGYTDCYNRDNTCVSSRTNNSQNEKIGVGSTNRRVMYGDYTSGASPVFQNASPNSTSQTTLMMVSPEPGSQVYDQIDRQIARETAMGLGQIQSQMYEANQIFKNLASMVNEQGETIHNLETSIDNTVYSAKQAVSELRKAYNSNSYRFSLLANYGLPAFLCLILVVILALHFLNLLL